MAQVRITELPESLTLDNNSVFPMVYNNVTQKITFKSLKDVMLYFENVAYDEKTGKFTFNRSNGTSSILSTNLNKAFKKVEIVNSDIVFTDFAGNTYTIDLLTEELQQKLTEINNKITANTKAIQKNETDIATNKSNITKNANDIKKINDSKGVANGFAELDSNGQVPSSQLPAYVDDVIEGYLYNGKFYEDYSHTILIPGESGKIYVDLVTEKTYRWTGTIFTVISETLALGETSSTAYRGDRGKIAYNHSQTTGNPHNTTKTDIGLSNVDNTADADKVVKEAKKTTGTLTIQKNGNTVITFNGSQSKSANIIVPTKTSELTNDSDFIDSQGTIAVANKVGTTTVGGSTTPVYINEGTPTPIGYSISKSVPADAVFTDTTYGNATQSKAGLMSATDKAKLDGVSSDADKVEWQQNVNTGVNIANVTINGTKTAIYAPTSAQYRGDMEKSVYDTNSDGIVDQAAKTTGELIIQKNSVDVGSFNGSTDKTLNITVPTNNNQLINGAGYQTASQVSNATVAKANQLTTSRKIDGVPFDGTEDINTYWNFTAGSNLQLDNYWFPLYIQNNYIGQYINIYYLLQIGNSYSDTDNLGTGLLAFGWRQNFNQPDDNILNSLSIECKILTGNLNKDIFKIIVTEDKKIQLWVNTISRYNAITGKVIGYANRERVKPNRDNIGTFNNKLFTEVQTQPNGTKYNCIYSNIASKLGVIRNINNVGFDGTQDIIIKANPQENNLTTQDLNTIRVSGFYYGMRWE